MTIPLIAQLLVSLAFGLSALWLMWGAWMLHTHKYAFTGAPTAATPILGALACGAGYLAYLFWPLTVIISPA